MTLTDLYRKELFSLAARCKPLSDKEPDSIITIWTP